MLKNYDENKYDNFTRIDTESSTSYKRAREHLLDYCYHIYRVWLVSLTVHVC